jgi:hypothetical protein
MGAMLRCVVALSLLALAACKQPVGGRCQVNEDCESGICSIAGDPRTCREGGSEVVVADAAPEDAKVDARVDATPSESDAALADAGEADAPVAGEADASAPDAQSADAD